MLPARVRAPLDRQPLAREGVLAALAFGGFLLWLEALRAVGLAVVDVAEPLLLVDSDVGYLAATGLVYGAVVVAGMVGFVAAYARVRDLPDPPDATDRLAPSLVPAVLVPALAVVAVHGVATSTGTSVAALTNTLLAPNASPVVPAVLAAVGLVVGLPAYVLVAHSLVQRTLRTTVPAWLAVGATTLLVGLVDPTALTRSGIPERTAAVTLVLAVAVALPAYAAAYDQPWLRWLSAVPFALFATGFVADWAAGLGGPAAATFAVGKVAVVGVGAVTYERTGSLFPPALAYTTFVVGTEAVALLVDGGVQP